MPSVHVLQCSAFMARKQTKIAFAESATAGRLCSEFALCPESGDILVGGIVSYDLSVKEGLLQIPAEITQRYTAESAEVTQRMAQSLMRFLAADVYVAVTGLARAGGSETPEKPVGTMFIHLLFNDKSIALRKVFTGDPEVIITQTVDYTAVNLLRYLNVFIR